MGNLSKLSDNSLQTLSKQSADELKLIADEIETTGVDKINNYLQYHAYDGIDNLKKKINWVTEMKPEVLENIPKVEIYSPAEGFMLETNVKTENDGIVVYNTKLTYTDGKNTMTAYAVREYDPNTGEFKMYFAGIPDDFPSIVNVSKGKLTSEGIPSITLMNLHQMKLAGVENISSIKMSNVVFKDTVLEISWIKKKYPEKSLDELIVYTSSYEYAHTIATQAGLTISNVKVTNASPKKEPPVPIIDSKLYPGLQSNDYFYSGFEIIIELNH